MNQAERYRAMRKHHKTCVDSHSHCRCHVFHLGPVPSVGDVISIVNHSGPLCEPVCGYAVVTDAGSPYSWLEQHHNFEVKVESVVSCPYHAPGDQMTLDNDNMSGVWWKPIELLERLAAV